MRECIVAEFENFKAARLGLEILDKAGFDAEEVSFVSRSDDPTLVAISSVEASAKEEVTLTSGSGAGGLMGALMAAPVAAGTLLAPLMVAGPLLAAGLGAAAGGLLGGKNRWGKPREAGDSYEKSVERGATLIFVTGREIDLNEAEASLKTAGPASIERFHLRAPVDG